MDKKNLTIGVILLVAAFGMMIFGPRAQPTQATPAKTTSASPAAPAGQPGAAPAPTATILAGTPTVPSIAAVATSGASDDAPTLENAYVRVRFTRAGGAIRDVAFVAREAGRIKYYAAGQPEQPYLFNELHADPMLALANFPGLDRGTRYEVVSSTRDQVVFRAVLDGRLEVTRTFTLSPNSGTGTDPYVIRHETAFRNLTDTTLALPKIEVSLGTAAPVHATGTDLLPPTTGYSDGEESTFVSRSDLQASGGFLGIGAHDARPEIAHQGRVVWGVVSNQFFAAILTPAEPASGLITRRVKLSADPVDTGFNGYGITGIAAFDVKALAGQGTVKLASDLYVGPKEFRRLSNAEVFTQNQDQVMQYSSFFIFRWCAQILSTLMSFFHGVLPGMTWGWGYAIILATLALKIVFVPLTFAAARSMKRMQKIQPEMMALREKYKDNPRKMQEGMMELYKVHKVNPLGGCIPMLIPLPFFMGFFSMLQSTAELRFAPFLWAPDLSAPDTIAHIAGIPINILPVLMGATMVIQMRLVPTPPTADNLQVKMMKFMPYIFAFFCYNFSCALSLYSTVNGLFTIGQQIIINRMKDDGDPVNQKSPAAPGGKPAKNVTPKKKA